MEITNIEWDATTQEKLEHNLPDAMKLPDDITDINDIADYIAAETGFCAKNFALNKP